MACVVFRICLGELLGGNGLPELGTANSFAEVGTCGIVGNDGNNVGGGSAFVDVWGSGGGAGSSALCSGNDENAVLRTSVLPASKDEAVAPGKGGGGIVGGAATIGVLGCSAATDISRTFTSRLATLPHISAAVIRKD